MRPFLWSVVLLCSIGCLAQGLPQTKDATAPQYKNVIRYNVSGAMLFNFDKYIVFGYERVVAPTQSFSVNFGFAALPKLVTISTADYNLTSDRKNTGINFSADYRFYLKKENRYVPPHGLYIGPYYSFNHFERECSWTYNGPSSGNDVETHSDINIHMVGFELGYQFVLWKRMTIDLVMVGPGIGFYEYVATFGSSIPATEREQLLDALTQVLTQKFPGMNFVFADQRFDADGTLRTSAGGYRYIMHIGFRF
jgi:hypothetical protein